MNREHERLLSLARSQVIAELKLADCWYFVTEAIENHWLGAGMLPELIERLRRGDSLGFQEIDFDWSLEEDDTMALTFVKDKYTFGQASDRGAQAAAQTL